MISTKNEYDNLELQIKKEAAILKTNLSQNFLIELRNLVKTCMLVPKDKKEQGVTEEKLNLNFLKLFKSQKKFQDSDNTLSNIRYLAVFDKETLDIGKIVSANFIDLTFEYYTYHDKHNKLPNKVKKWSDVKTFDYNTLQLDYIYDLYKHGPNASLSYIEMQSFLSGKEFKNKTEIKKELNYYTGFGTLLEDANEHPIIIECKKDYDISSDLISVPKRKLQKLDPITLEILESFISYKEAKELTNISASSIANVLCKGIAAINYTEAGGFKWKWSDELNMKYDPIWLSKKKEEDAENKRSEKLNLI
jgi:hypothetical protein